MNAKNGEIKKALTKAVKDARKDYAKKNLDALVEKLIAMKEDDKASTIKVYESAKAEIEKIDSDPTYLVQDDDAAKRLGADWRRKIHLRDAAYAIDRFPERIARIGAAIERLRTDAKHAANEAFKLVHLEARMNAAQSRKNTFTLQRDYFLEGQERRPDPNQVADAAADAMEDWMKANGINYRRGLDEKREGYGTIQYVRFTWAD